MAIVYIAVETHPDKGIGGVFLNKEKADKFIEDNFNKAYNKHLYMLCTEELDDEEILQAYGKIIEHMRLSR